MSTSFFFYDLETSGFNPKEARIMQFAGQRTTLDLEPIGEPHNYLIKLHEDVLPEPDAVLITGITPQKTHRDGITEADFLRIFQDQIALSQTIFVGFNTVRFDDEFMRYLHYRNYYDPYEWQYQDGRSRWDLLDLARMTRALRPDGLVWPYDDQGKPSCRLELLTRANGLQHQNAHDALSDVQASIAVARLIRTKQQKLFDYLLNLRDKQNVAQLAKAGQPFVYTSGKYASEFEKTTVVGLLAEHPSQKGSALVFDLRHDPQEFAALQPAELVSAWRRRRDDPGPRLPIKVLKYNRCPAVAPLAVLDEPSQARLQLDPKVYEAHWTTLQAVSKELQANLFEALRLMDKQRQTNLIDDETDVDSRLYEEFFGSEDKTKMSMVRAASPDELKDLDVTFKDSRLAALLPLYKARNYPQALHPDERADWERYLERKLLGGGTQSRLARYFGRLGELDAVIKVAEKRYLLEELQLYGQSVMPASPDH